MKDQEFERAMLRRFGTGWRQHERRQRRRRSSIIRALFWLVLIGLMGAAGAALQLLMTGGLS